jgi:PHD/YefM family antitoxin component YafN of YafNO toxin-antitoxin module
MPINHDRRLPVENINFDRGRATITSPNQLITREEYEALMSELDQKIVSKSLTSIPVTAERLRRLEFNLMILVGLILAIFMFMAK